MASATPLKLASGKLKQFSATDTVPLANGGTNASLTASNGGIVYSTASGLAILTATATAGKMLRSGSSAAPTWSTATFPVTATGTGTILRADGINWVESTNTFPDTTPIGQILFATSANIIGGSTTFLSDGTYLCIGATSFAGGESFLFQKNQSPRTSFVVGNSTSSTTAACYIMATNTASGDGGAGVGIGSLSAAYTTSGIYVQNAGVIFSSKTAGLNVGTTIATQFSFWTNNTERGRFLSTGEFLVGYSSLATDEIAGFQKNQNARTLFGVSNTTSGTAGFVQILASISSTLATGTSINSHSAAYTTSGIRVADAGALISSNVAGLNAGTNIATQFSFWTNDTERARFLSTGEFLVGRTAVYSTELASFTRNANSANYISVVNTTSGTAGSAGVFAHNTAGFGTYVGMVAFSAAYTTSGMLVQDCAAIYTNKAAGMNVGNRANTPLSFWTNDTQRASVNAGGGFVIQSGNKMWMKNTVSNTNYWSAVLVSGVLTWTDSGSTALPTT
jgi:hypothetical protein